MRMRKDTVQVEWNCQTADAERCKLGGGERGGWNGRREKRKEKAGKNKKELKGEKGGVRGEVRAGELRTRFDAECKV